MSWEAIGVIAEVISAIAVIITLLHLAREVRLNRVAVEADSIDSLSQGWNNLNTQMMNDPELANIRAQGFADPGSLDAVQRVRFMFVAQSYINQFMTVKKRYESGTLPEEEWLIHAAGTAHIFNSPGGKEALSMVAATPGIAKTLQEFGEKYPREDGYVGITKGHESAG